MESDYDHWTKVTFWAACTLIWNGSLRVHEALSRSQYNYDPQTTLLKSDVEIFTESINHVNRSVIRILIKSPKEDRIGKDMCLEIFGNNTFLCPVRALNKYLSERTKVDKSNQDLPFFLKQDSKYL